LNGEIKFILSGRRYFKRMDI